MNSGIKFLPIGSVVLLKNAKKRIMIIGYCPITADRRFFDYSGVIYPEGMINSQTNLFFNQSDIEQVFAQGFADDESKDVTKKLEESYASFPRKSNGEIDADGVMRLLAQKVSQNSASASLQQSAPKNAYDEVELPSIDIED